VVAPVLTKAFHRFARAALKVQVAYRKDSHRVRIIHHRELVMTDKRTCLAVSLFIVLVNEF
jgi:hypothetical protein